MDLQGKTILVTGAARGLGQKMAELIANQAPTLPWPVSITKSLRKPSAELQFLKPVGRRHRGFDKEECQ